MHGEDLNIVDRDKYTYILTYSFPCQDLSIAGHQKGMAKGSGTRSGLLWEVERLLKECNGNLPQILLFFIAVLYELVVYDNAFAPHCQGKNLHLIPNLFPPVMHNFPQKMNNVSVTVQKNPDFSIASPYVYPYSFSE